MKTLKLKNTFRFTVIIAALLFSTTLTFAKTPPSAEKNALAEVQKEILHSQLNDIVDYPENTYSCVSCGIVKAEVTVDEDGSLIINEINGHPDFKSHVQKQLNEVTVADYTLIGKTFIAKFDFRK
jgi:D-alanine-D-alanine ligase-like ATP-grasp enzyme